MGLNEQVRIDVRRSERNSIRPGLGENWRIFFAAKATSSGVVFKAFEIVLIILLFQVIKVIHNDTGHHGGVIFSESCLDEKALL